MRLLTLLAGLGLAAVSSGEGSVAPGPQADPGAGLSSESRAFRDWIAICDNGNACFAFGRSGGTGWIRVAMDPGPDARPAVAAGYWPEEAEATRSSTLTVDGTDYPMKLADNEPVAAEVPAGRALEVVRALADGGSARIGPDHPLSLSGAAAALLWIDERQGRVGTVTALRRGGARPASTVPTAPALPIVTPAQGAPQAGFGDRDQVLPASLEALPAVQACRAETSHIEWIQTEIMSARLDASTELWAVPCFPGAYNIGHDWYLTGPDGRDPRPAGLASANGEVASSTINGGYAANTRTLVAFAKGRGPGDCGSLRNWVWTGRAFVLSEESEMTECWGVPPDYWPTTWQTR